MSFVAVSLNNLMGMDGSWDNRQLKWKPIKGLLNNKDTYICIFSKDQKEKYDLLMKQPNIKIIYQSQPAVNYVHDARELRTFVVMFEVV